MSALLDRRLQDSNRTAGRERRRSVTTSTQSRFIFDLTTFAYASDHCHCNSVAGPRKQEEGLNKADKTDIIYIRQTLEKEKPY